MKKEYVKPAMQVIELKQQGFLLQASKYTPEAGYKSVRGLDKQITDFVWDEDGLDDEEFDL